MMSELLQVFILDLVDGILEELMKKITEVINLT
jgi:hypothetical protein